MRCLFPAILAVTGHLYGQSTETFGGTFDTLKPPQKALLQEFAQRFERTTGKKLDLEKAYNDTRLSDRTTYEAVTHALMTTKLTGEDNKPLGVALDIVDTIEYVAGEVPGARGDRQFRLYVILKPGAVDVLTKSREFNRERDNSVYHKGYPQCFRLKGKPPNIQISISTDEKRADVDVDYRSSKFPTSLVNGHLTASNSDVRAGNNDERHNQRWLGLAGWWRNFFGMGQGAESKNRPANQQARVSGKSPLDEAVHDFLTAWLVEQKPSIAVTYFSHQADACIEAEAARNGRKVETGMARFVAIGAMERANRSLGKVSRIADVARSVPVVNPQIRAAKNQYPDEFTLVDVSDHVGENSRCGERGAKSAPPDKPSFGNYHASAFRIYSRNRPGVIIYFLWTKLDGQWQIVAYRTAEELAPELTPNIAATAAEEEVKTAAMVPGDPGAISAIRNWLKTWAVDRDIPGTMQAFAPQSLACIVNADPDFKGKTNREMAAALRKGLAEAFRESPKGSSLGQFVEAVNPVQDYFPLVDHPDRESVAIIKIPDQMAAELSCASSKNPARPKDPTYNALFYASLTRLKVEGEGAAIYCLWQREGTEWKITAWRVESP